MERVDIFEGEPVPLRQVMGAHDLFIDFQLPALLCYCTLAVVPILTKAGLIENINRLLAGQPHLVQPGDTDLTNWKLTNNRGEVVKIQAWEAMQHVGTTIMVTFDREYENGEHRGPILKMYAPEHISSLLSRGLPVSERDFPKLRDDHRIVQIEFCRPGAWRKGKPRTWLTERTEIYLVSDDLKLRVLASALVDAGTVDIRLDEVCSLEYRYCHGLETLREIGEAKGITKLEFLID